MPDEYGTTPQATKASEAIHLKLCCNCFTVRVAG